MAADTAAADADNRIPAGTKPDPEARMLATAGSQAASRFVFRRAPQHRKNILTPWAMSSSRDHCLPNSIVIPSEAGGEQQRINCAVEGYR